MAERFDHGEAASGMERILDELELLRASLLPHETIEFLDESDDEEGASSTVASAGTQPEEGANEGLERVGEEAASAKNTTPWRALLDARTSAGFSSSLSSIPNPPLARLGRRPPARVALRSEGAGVWLEATFHLAPPLAGGAPDVRVHTEQLARTEHARWQEIVEQHAQEADVVDNE